MKRKTVEDRNRQLIFVISGPSGSGKTTLLEKLLSSKKVHGRLIQSISYTTRPKRSTEREGRDYFFITEEIFRRKLKAKKILEWTKYLGYYYATPKDFVEKQFKKDRHIVLCLDLKGTLKLKRLYPNKTVTIFIIPPSLQALRGRIEGRCSRTKKTEIHNRLRIAKEELLACRKYDHCLVNKNLRTATRQLREIVLREIGGLVWHTLR